MCKPHVSYLWSENNFILEYFNFQKYAFTFPLSLCGSPHVAVSRHPGPYSYGWRHHDPYSYGWRHPGPRSIYFYISTHCGSPHAAVGGNLVHISTFNSINTPLSSFNSYSGKNIMERLFHSGLWRFPSPSMSCPGHCACCPLLFMLPTAVHEQLCSRCVLCH